MRAALSCVARTTANGTVALIVRNHSGSTKTFNIPAANVTVALVEQIGVSFVFEYHIQGGAMVAA
jgi:hypothetical protein